MNNKDNKDNEEYEKALKELSDSFQTFKPYKSQDALSLQDILKWISDNLCPKIPIILKVFDKAKGLPIVGKFATVLEPVFKALQEICNAIPKLPQ